MPEKYIPKVGDRVRVTGLEGVVGEIDSSGLDIEVEDAVGDKKLAYLPAAAIPSIEKLGPNLPTVPGSVIRSTFGYLYFLTPTGWRNQYGGECINRKRPAISNFEVLFDAGAVK